MCFIQRCGPCIAQRRGIIHLQVESDSKVSVDCNIN